MRRFENFYLFNVDLKFRLLDINKYDYKFIRICNFRRTNMEKKIFKEKADAEESVKRRYWK